MCKVPPFMNRDITEPVVVDLFVTSSTKKSEPHSFVYTPTNETSRMLNTTSIASIQRAIANRTQGIYSGNDIVRLGSCDLCNCNM